MRNDCVYFEKGSVDQSLSVILNLVEFGKEEVMKQCQLLSCLVRSDLHHGPILLPCSISASAARQHKTSQQFNPIFQYRYRPSQELHHPSRFLWFGYLSNMSHPKPIARFFPLVSPDGRSSRLPSPVICPDPSSMPKGQIIS
jgi:hypothetical protein